MRALTSSLLFVLAFSACPNDPNMVGGDGCLEPVVDSAQLRAPLADFGVQGFPLTRIVEGPLTTCATSSTVQFEVTAPGNRTVAPTSVTTPMVTGKIASAAVTFTPDAPGKWRVSALFPGLGSRTVEVEVLANRTDAPTPFVTPPGVSCPKGPWLFDDLNHAACEQPDASIAYFPLDGGTLATLPGQQLVVVKNVWWLLTPPGNELERYTWDAGLTRTHAWANFTWTPIRGVHTATSAVRAAVGFSVRAVDVDNLDTMFPSGSAAFVSGIFWLDRDENDAGVINSLPGSFNDDWTGVEPNVVWTNRDNEVSPNRRPFEFGMPTAAGFKLGNAFAKPERAPLARWPVWMVGADLNVSASERPAGISVVAWPQRTLVRATDDVLVFGSEATGFSFTRY